MTTKKKISRVLKVLGALLGISLLVVILGFVNRERKAVDCWKLDVKVDRAEGYYFVDEEDILQAVYALGDSLIGTPMDRINVDELRTAVSGVAGVRKTDVFKTIDGRVCVKVKQCQPLARIINEDGSGFYLDHDGGTVPLSRKFTARVPIVLGNVNEPIGLSVHALRANPELAEQSQLDEIYELMDFIENHSLMRHQVDHIKVDQFHEFTIIPRVGNHRIAMGDHRDLELKMEKLMAFYQQNISSRDLNKYTEIDLRFKDQVVCRKRSY